MAIWLRRRPLPFVIAIVVCVLLLTGGLHLLTGEGRGTNSSRHGAKDCGSGAIAFTLAASSEKAQLTRQLAVDYMSKGHRVDGRCVKVVVVSKSSGEAMAALARGWDMTADGPRPDVWSPASSSWVRLLQQRTVTTDHAAFELIPKDLPSIAATPLVVAMPRPMAEALGWPRKQLGWVDLLALSRDRRGWRALDHSDWGAFSLGKTNPNFSTSGLEATIGAFFAATGSTSDLTVRDVTNSEVQRFVAGVERSVVHYGDTTLTFLSNLQRADDQELGLHYISAVTVEEKSVWDYNQGNPSGDPATLGKHHKPHVPLVAIYPKEGTLFSDNPYVVLPASWVDDAKRKAAADFLAYLRSGPAQTKFERAAFRNYARQPGPLITKANGLLPRQEIPVLPPPAPAIIDRILVSWAALRKPANLLLVIDVSGSMEDPVEGTGKSKLDLAKQAAISSLSQLTSRDHVGLWIFSTKLNGNIDYRELVGIGPMNGQINGKQRRTLIKAKIQTLSPDGKTGLYDTALASYKFIKDRRSLDSINAVILLTDGINQDNSGGISLSDLLAALRPDEGDEAIRVFTIAYGSNTDPTVLKRIAQVTNGAYYDSSDPTSINRVFTTVFSNF